MGDEKIYDQREALYDAGAWPARAPSTSRYATYEDWEQARCPLNNREVQRIVDDRDKLRAENERLVKTHRAAEDLAVIMTTEGIKGRPQIERDAYQRLVSTLRPLPSEGDAPEVKP